jgi:hypothetical protein
MKTRVTLKATIGTPNAKKSARQESTPLAGSGSLVAMRNGELMEVITVRTYYNPKGSGMQPVRASVWITPATDTGKDWPNGRGDAGGCGYHKESAAIAEAIDNAGILLWGEPYRYSAEPVDFKKRAYFGGTGASAYPEIFKAIARAVGYRGRMAWVSHGL